MKLLREATRRIKSCASPRTLVVAVVALLGVLLPAIASAGEADVKLDFGNGGQTYLAISGAFGIFAILFAWWISASVLKSSPGSAKMQEVGLAIKEGALAYLTRQIKTMIWFVAALAIGLYFLYHNLWVSVSFMGGVAASYIAGFSGMLMAVNGNMRTANAALTSYKQTLEIAFRSGAVAGMVTVGMGLIGATLILWLGGSGAMTLLIGFGFGGSLAALFMRVGGGIFTKAADVGADLVGKVEAGIPEDDPRNPATIADNVGDNVGDCAGMAADVFESYEVTLVAAIVLGAATSALFDSQTWMKLILFALMARGIGILASAIGIVLVKGTDDVDADPLGRIRRGFYGSALIAAVLTAGLAWFMTGQTPIQTLQLTTYQDYEQSQVDRLLQARFDYGLAHGYKPENIWQVPAKELAALPGLQDIGNDQPAAAGADATKARAMALMSVLQAPDNVANERALTPQKLTGYSKLDANGTNPALDGTIQAIPKSKAEEEEFRKEPTGKWVGVRDSLKDGHLDLVALVTETSLPSAPGQPPQKPSKQYQIMNKDYAAEQQKAPSAPKGDIIPVTLMANAEGRLAVAIDAPVKDLRSASSPLSQGVILCTPDYLKKFFETIRPNPAKPNEQPDYGSLGFPHIRAAKVASVQHTTVPWWAFFVAVFFGIGMAFAIEMLTDYYVSTHKRPTQEVAGVSSAGPAPMIIQGFAYAAESSVFMVLAIVVALLVPLYLFSPATYGSPILSFYGIALVGLGLLTTTGFVLAMDTFGPISDNAQGVYEMSGEGHDNEYGQKSVQRLDAAGNTTKALTKGFAIATAVVAAVALFHSYLEDAKLGSVGLRLDVPEIFLGLLIGGAAPYLFSAFAINAVGRASFQLINEVRRQFKADPGIMLKTSKPDYGACVSIVTAAAQKELLGPGILAIFLPIAVAFGFSIGKAPTLIGDNYYNLTGAEALGGFLAGAILSGQLMAVLLANSGGMWDNAKKIIEDGLYGGKGTEAHKAGVVVDTVGDPFKDTAGPAMNPLIKVMNLVALLLAPVIIKPFGLPVLASITGVAVVLLIISIYFSKRGSLSTEMMKATDMAHTQAEVHKDPSHGQAPSLEDGSSTPPTSTKKRITVDDPADDA